MLFSPAITEIKTNPKNKKHPQNKKRKGNPFQRHLGCSMIRSVGRALLQYFFCGLYCYFKNGFPLPSRGRCGLMISRRRRLSVTRSGNLCGCEGYNREGNFSDAQNFDGTIDNANVLPYFVKKNIGVRSMPI